MARLIWTEAANRDFGAVCAFIAKSSEANARKVARELSLLADSIPDQPYLGVEVPEYSRPDIRERQCHNFRLLYRIRDDDIVVLTITHGSKRLPRTPPEGE